MRIDRNQTHLGSAGHDAGHGADRSGVLGVGVGLPVYSMIPVAQACIYNAAAAVVATSRKHIQSSMISSKWARREAGR